MTLAPQVRGFLMLIGKNAQFSAAKIDICWQNEKMRKNSKKV